MNEIYRQVGISKQGFHQWLDRSLLRYEEQQQLLPIIRQLREDHPKMSSREFYFMLNPHYMGRDRFEAFCHEYGYKVQLKKTRYKTTDSRGIIRFPNLLLHLDELTGVNQLWVSDITYFQLNSNVYYLTFIMDIFNREIVGYSVADNLKTESTTLPALQMTIKARRLTKESGMIFHSDGGGQYYCTEFVNLTKNYGIKNSMGKTAYENPHAERINGTIKNYYLIPWGPQNRQELTKMLTKAVYLYNNERPHKMLGRRSPQKFIQLVNKGLLTKTWVVNKKKKVSKKEKVNIYIT